MTREEFRDYVEFLRSQDEISYDVYSVLIDAIDTLEQEPKTGHWIIKSETSAVCSCCHKNNLFYGDFCKWCGEKMQAESE